MPENPGFTNFPKLAELTKALIMLSTYIGQPQEDARLKMYAQDLMIYGETEVKECLARMRFKIKFFPSMEEIIHEIQGKASPKTEALLSWYRLRNQQGPKKYRLEELNENPVALYCFNQQGGSGSFGDWGRDRETFERKEYVDLYLSVLERYPTLAEQDLLNEREHSKIPKWETSSIQIEDPKGEITNAKDAQAALQVIKNKLNEQRKAIEDER